MKKNQLLTLLFGGLLPIVAFTVIEDQYGPLWGTVAGMVFGIGEVIYEVVRYRKVNTITWVSNAMILVLGSISIFTQDGVWFKLQPALFEALFVGMLWGSLLGGKSLMLSMAEKQGMVISEVQAKWFRGLSFRLGLFFVIHCALAVEAALHWSTAAWAILKGVGLTVSLMIYMVAEAIIFRRKLKNASAPSDKP